MKQTRILPYASVLMASWLWVSAGCEKSPPPEGVSRTPAGASQAPEGVSEKPQEAPKKDAAVRKPAPAIEPSITVTKMSGARTPNAAAEAPASDNRVKIDLELPESGQSAETQTRKVFHTNGKLRREWQVMILPDGSEVEHGRMTAYHDNGQIYLDGYYVNGERDGKCPSWYPNGQLRGSGQFELGMRIGTWTHYHENGQKRAEYSFVDGLKEGTYTIWKKNGSVMEQGEYVRDQKHGTWITVDPNGNKIETRWVNGVQQD